LSFQAELKLLEIIEVPVIAARGKLQIDTQALAVQVLHAGSKRAFTVGLMCTAAFHAVLGVEVANNRLLCTAQSQAAGSVQHDAASMFELHRSSISCCWPNRGGTGRLFPALLNTVVVYALHQQRCLLALHARCSAGWLSPCTLQLAMSLKDDQANAALTPRTSPCAADPHTRPLLAS
jgi:hypothetical protein